MNGLLNEITEKGFLMDKTRKESQPVKKVRLPIGQSDFRKIIEGGFDFVDKSDFIPAVLRGAAEVILITRPRRFGKTLNMSMLRCFFAPEVQKQPTKDLFKGLKVSKEGEDILQHQGKYPVIFLTFKDVKEDSFETAYKNIYQLILEVYEEFSYLLESSSLSNRQKDFFEYILKRKADQSEIANSLKTLTSFLFQHHGVKPMILIDEYDTPIQSGYLQGYYDEVIAFFRKFFGTSLKDNPCLFKAVLTGILRVSRESLFSGLNNLKVHSVLHPQLSSFFGFTEDEVNQLLNKSGFQGKADDIKHWYNGYQMGDTVLYNPWSIVNCIEDGGVLKPFWVNTSDNILIKDLLLKSSVNFKDKFETLLHGTPVERVVDENFVFPDLQKNRESAIWSLLLMTGYLTVRACEETNRGPVCQLAIPNQEIRNLYQVIIERWLANGYGLEWYEEFLNHLLNGDMEEFQSGLHHIMEHIVSVHDVGKKEPESFYHGFMIGLTASLAGDKRYETRSNRESGYGRYDYLILARDPNKLSILLEFKQVPLPTGKKETEKMQATLDKAAQEALQQINQQVYFAEIQQRGLTNILKIGLAFSGKRFGMASERE
jgi:hypothetical protein